MLAAGAVLDALIMPGPLHENPPHRQCGCCKEMAPAIPFLRRTIARDTQIRLVDERGRLERLMPLAFAGQAGSRELPQFVIHFREQLAGRASRSVRIAGAGHAKAAPL